MIFRQIDKNIKNHIQKNDAKDDDTDINMDWFSIFYDFFIFSQGTKTAFSKKIQHIYSTIFKRITQLLFQIISAKIVTRIV